MSLRSFLSALALATSLTALLPLDAAAQTVPAGKTRIFLWEGRRAPIVSPRPSYIPDTTYTATDSVKNPWMISYVPTNPNGTAVVLIPGGGYRNLGGWNGEGPPAAQKLQALGITVFILRYRVDPYRHPHPMWDVQRAVRWVRAHAKEYSLNTNRIGVLGFSAGGHVATAAVAHFDAGLVDSNAANGPHWHPAPKDSIDRVSSRVNFQALVYPMTTMVQYVPGTTSTAYAYADGRAALLGPSPSADLVTYTSHEKHVTAQTPPAWINWGTADNLVNPLNSRAYRDSLLAKGVRADTLVVVGGGHDPAQTARIDSLGTWLNARGYLTALQPRVPRALPAGAFVPAGKRLDARGRVSERPTGVALKSEIPETPKASEARR
jgi:acetyl esterase/lipase